MTKRRILIRKYIYIYTTENLIFIFSGDIIIRFQLKSSLKSFQLDLWLLFLLWTMKRLKRFFGNCENFQKGGVLRSCRKWQEFRTTFLFYIGLKVTAEIFFDENQTCQWFFLNFLIPPRVELLAQCLPRVTLIFHGGPCPIISPINHPRVVNFACD